MRGQNLPTTIRMTGLVIDQFHKDKAALHRDNPPDWERLWGDTISDYERQFNPENWVSVHVNGKPYFSTIHNSRVDLIEKAAKGGDVTKKAVRSAAKDIIEAAEKIVIEHDSQTALVMTETSKWTKCALLQRQDGGNSSFSITIYRDKKPLNGPKILFLAANLVEATNLHLFLENVRSMVANNKVTNRKLTPAQVKSAINRGHELAVLIRGFEERHKVHYRPERPAFLGVA